MNEQQENKVLDYRRPTGAEWQKKHRALLERAQVVARALRERGHTSEAHKVEECGRFEELVCCASCGNHWYEVAHCDQRVCPVCAQRVAVARSRRVEVLAATAKAPKMLTLTMPRWLGKPRKGIEKLREGIRQLRETDIMRTCKAGAYCVELVRKKDGWHIHAHLIVDADYIPQKRLIGAWSACIRVKGAHVRVQGASAKAVQRYICKYASKAGVGELADEEIVDWFEAVKGSRLWATWGAWYGAKAKEVADKALALRPRACCPFCGEQGHLFCAKAGQRIWGDAWADVRKYYVGELQFRQRIITKEAEEEPRLKEAWYDEGVMALWA